MLRTVNLTVTQEGILVGLTPISRGVLTTQMSITGTRIIAVEKIQAYSTKTRLF
jgi:hypothetical protein